jgi:16S rRNA (uracil1498-N3)-methyltransferase
MQALADAKIRLFLDHPLAAGQSVPLTQAQAHYLFSVMRQPAGAAVLGFNGRDGEWLCHVERVGKRGGALLAIAQTRPQQAPPDLWLLFAPIKKARTDFIVEKAVELGVARLLPVQTEFTNAERLSQSRARAHAIEAAEQCGGTFIPEIAELTRLDRLLADWPAGRRLAFCDETAAPGQGFAGAPRGPWAVLIGPEGGFSEAERQRLLRLPFVTRISLGPRILRADTAAVAALTLWQATLGDWT